MRLFQLIRKLSSPFMNFTIYRVYNPSLQQFTAMRISLKRTVDGFGFLCNKDNNCTVKYVSKGSDADKAGIKPGDMLKSVNDFTVADIHADDLTRFIWSLTPPVQFEVSQTSHLSFWCVHNSSCLHRRLRRLQR